MLIDNYFSKNVQIDEKISNVSIINSSKYILFYLKRQQKIDNIYLFDSTNIILNETIDLKNCFFYNTNNNYKYALKGVICFLGEENDGHYIYISKEENSFVLYENGKGYKRSKQELKELIYKTSVLVFYEKLIMI